MDPIRIGNAWDNCEGLVMLVVPMSSIVPGHKISFYIGAGSLLANHVMTSEQARTAAAALLAMADEADKRDGVVR